MATKLRVPGVTKIQAPTSRPKQAGAPKAVKVQLPKIGIGGGPTATPITTPTKLTPITPTTPAPAPGPPQPTPTVGAPPDLTGLTGDQQAAAITAWAKYKTSIDNLGLEQKNLGVRASQDQATEGQNYVRTTAAENNSAAARGLSHSSIRDGDLNDIDAAHALNLQNIQDNLAYALGQIGNTISGLNTDWLGQQGLFNWYRIQNSQAQPPPVNTAPAAPAAPTAPKPPKAKPIQRGAPGDVAFAYPGLNKGVKRGAKAAVGFLGGKRW